VGSGGNLTLASDFPTFVPSPGLNFVSIFKPGKYVGPPSLTGYGLTVSGPAIVAGGVAQWTFTQTTGANNNTYPNSGSWYVVNPNSLATNPIYARLKAAGITSTTSVGMSYGLIGEPFGAGGSGYWTPNGILGATQVGNVITFSSFTYAGTNDYNLPKNTIPYTLVP
jgi:hypothetical protein